MQHEENKGFIMVDLKLLKETRDAKYLRSSKM